jgi:hypothetical protein
MADFGISGTEHCDYTTGELRHAICETIKIGLLERPNINVMILISASEANTNIFYGPIRPGKIKVNE